MRVVREVILEEDRAFIERMDMFFLASADSGGQPQCYIHRMALVERSPYVPRRGHTPPVPEWKRELAEGVLAPGDRAADPSAT